MIRVRHLQDQRGSALPVVVGILLVLGIIVAVVATTSMHVRESTSGDRASKRAFQAAEAGLQVAAYRLRKILPAASDCLTTAPVAPTGGVCPTTPAESAGNGATFSYSVTNVLASGSTACALPAGADFANYDYRCITSVGTVQGKTRRVQAILASGRTAGKFPLNGVLSMNKLSQSGSSSVNGEFGANAEMKFSGSTLPTTPVLLGPNGKVSPSSVPYTLQPADFTAPRDDAAFLTTGGTTGPPPVAAQNDNAQLLPLPAGVTLNAQRMLSSGSIIGSAASPWVIPSGTYNFCGINFSNKAYLQVAPGAQVHIYIDSPNRPGSGCPAGSGDFSATNTFSFGNPSNDPGALMIEMYGGTGTTFKISNTATFYGLIYAPETDFTSTGTGSFVGGIVARDITTSNTFNVTGAVPQALLHGNASFASRGWIECVPNGPAGGAQGAGC